MTEEDRAAALRLQEFLSTQGVPSANVGIGLTETADGRVTCLFIYCTEEAAQHIGEINSFENYPVRISSGHARSMITE
ncbi:hypothetical protein [Methylobacterium sp. J-070]|uniref:hypothetical protein n=1 Tax=Methylobacterium sp. J-070 TaxID=2836650 RepID=UPI001FBBEC94|nr:hypothetical protein [Methylobacterium sp. J-070]MCJ2049333.1 hypothetical protein [Methylobacterium sp. J-070]